MRERRELLPEGEFRETLAPRFHLAVDSRGRIYAVDQVDYEIRKYGAEGEYLGDFRILEDPEYRPPPESLDMERAMADPAYREDWLWSWSRVASAIVSDRYLVVALQSSQRGGYRLHFYTLEGGRGFEPIHWESRLIDADVD